MTDQRRVDGHAWIETPLFPSFKTKKGAFDTLSTEITRHGGFQFRDSDSCAKALECRCADEIAR